MIKKADIIVIGGGPSGIMAAKTAASEGASVIILERYGFLGGAATISLVVPLMTFHAGNKQIIGGYPQKLIDNIIENGGSIGHFDDPIGFGSSITPVETEIYKYEAQEFLLESNVTILYHTELIGVEIKDGQIEFLRVKTRSGVYELKADQYIDATGDCEVAYYSGFDYKTGRDSDGKTQPMSMMFRLSGVDRDKVIDYTDKHPEQFVLSDKINSLHETVRFGISGFFDLVEEAKENNDLDLDRDRVLLFEMNRKGEVMVNMSRVINKTATNNHDLSEATIIGRRQVFNIWKFLKKYIPGFENTVLEETPTQIGVRETRRIQGEYVITADDIIHSRKFDDGIALGSWPIDIHSPDGKELVVMEFEKGSYYQIPYRTMIPKGSKNLLVTGRGISSTHEAFASTRVSPTCMALGQASGMASYIALKDKVNVKDIDITKLKRELERIGQILD